MHPPSEDFKVELGHSQLVILVVKGRLIPIVFVVELLVVLELASCHYPGHHQEQQTEERPPDANSEAPDHTLLLIFKHVHHCCR